MSTVYAPMDVVFKEHAGGRKRGPVPAFDPSWSRIDQLRWRTGCIKARTGLTVNLHDGNKASCTGYTYEWPEHIGVMIPGCLSLSQGDDHIDTYLHGLEDGASAVAYLSAQVAAAGDSL